MRRSILFCAFLILCSAAYGQSYRITKLGVQYLLPLQYLAEWRGGEMTAKADGSIVLAQHSYEVRFRLRGLSPLHLAVYRGNLETVHYLAGHGADAKARTADGAAP